MLTAKRTRLKGDGDWFQRDPVTTSETQEQRRPVKRAWFQPFESKPLRLIKRAVPLALLFVALIAPLEAQGSSSEGLRAQAMMSCGKGSGGWVLWRGAGVSGMPRTSCSFVRATHRKLMGIGKLPRRFSVTVRGYRLSCRKKRESSSRVFVSCKSRTKWVGLSEI